MKSVILMKKANEVIPTDLALMLAEKFPAASGAMCVVPAAVGPGNVMQFVGNPKKLDENDLDTLQETFAEDNLLLYMSSEAGPDDMQPFELVTDAENQVVLTCMIEGEFPDYAEDDLHSDAYYLYHNYLHKRVNTLHKMAKGDMAKFVGKLREPAFAEEIGTLSDKRGQITFLTITGEIITFPINNSDLKEFPWGWVSHPHGYGVAAVAEPEPAAAGGFGSMVRGAAGKVKRVMGGKPTAAIPDTQPLNTAVDATKAGQQVLIKAADKKADPKSSTAIPTAPAAEEGRKIGKIVQADPKNQSSRKKVKNYYKHHAGFLPDNYMEYPAVRSTRFFDLSDLGENLNVASSIQTDDKGIHTVQETKPVAAAKPDTSLRNPEIAEKALPSATLLANQILHTSEKKKVEDFLKSGLIKKTLDKSSLPINTPETIQKMESKQPSFAKQMGIDYDATLIWPFEAIDDLGKEVPHALAVLCANHQVTILKLRAALAAKGGEKGYPERIEDETTKHILGNEELRPTRKHRSMGGQRQAM